MLQSCTLTQGLPRLDFYFKKNPATIFSETSHMAVPAEKMWGQCDDNQHVWMLKALQYTIPAVETSTDSRDHQLLF